MCSYLKFRGRWGDRGRSTSGAHVSGVDDVVGETKL